MNILILAAGDPEFDSRDAHDPLCLTELDGLSLIQRTVMACDAFERAQFTFALRKEEANRFHLDNVMSQIKPGSVTLKVNADTAGAACTALLAAEQINNDQELLVLSANELLDVDFAAIVADFRARHLDAGVIIFPSVHPRYSYVRVDEKGFVTEAAEKNPVSAHATAGFYWYSKGSLFVEAVKDMIRKEASIDGRFYVCPAFNEMVLKHALIGTYPISAKQYHPLKTERQLQQYEALRGFGGVKRAQEELAV
jgi:hypothetical protein